MPYLDYCVTGNGVKGCKEVYNLLEGLLSPPKNPENWTKFEKGVNLGINTLHEVKIYEIAEIWNENPKPGKEIKPKQNI